MIRPQQKAQKKRAEMLSNVKPGAEVVLISGLHGKLDRINADKSVVIDADGIYLTFEQSAIRTIVPAKEETTDVPATEDKATEEVSAEVVEALKSVESEAEPETKKAGDAE